MTSDRFLELLRYLPLPLTFLVFYFQLRRLRLHPRPEDARVIRWLRWFEVLIAVYIVVLLAMRR